MDGQFASPAPLLTSKRRLGIFLLLMTSMFMSTLDHQIVSTALPTIVGEFGQIERFGWIGSSYLLALSAVMPVYGKLGDLFGRKYVMMASVALFVLGSAVCGFAFSMNSLIAARVLQGLGGGGIMVSVFAVTADLFEPRDRARHQSYSSLVLMASSAVGPVLGGAMSDLFGWRSIFLINLPLGAAVLAGLAVMLPFRKPARKPTIDYAGAILLACATTSVVLFADASEMFGSLLSLWSLTIVAFGATCAVLWVFVERRAAEPIVPLSLFANRTYTLLLLVTLLGGAISIGLGNYFALFLQTTTGLSPSQAGLLFLFLTTGIVCGSLGAGRMIARSGRYKAFAIASFVLSALALLAMTQVHSGSSLAVIAAIMAFHGIGIGLAQQVPLIGVQDIAPDSDMGAATGSVTLCRMGGASIAISIYGAIIGAQLHHIDLALPNGQELRQLTPKLIADLPVSVQQAVADAYSAPSFRSFSRRWQLH